MIDRKAIEGLIPHRSPFLWIDEIVEISDRAVQARKFLELGLDVFAGHYPGNPILPGVLHCEATFQAGAVLIARIVPPAGERIPVVARINNVKFRRIVRPGETLDIFAELTERVAGAFFLKGRTTVGGQTACTLDFVCTLADANSE